MGGVFREVTYYMRQKNRNLIPRKQMGNKYFFEKVVDKIANRVYHTY